jgi:hypothetical protein
MAIVADEKWQDRALPFAGKGLRRIDIDVFPPRQMSDARNWLTSVF